jgi:hypothetical protein
MAKRITKNCTGLNELPVNELLRKQTGNKEFTCLDSMDLNVTTGNRKGLI